MMARRRSRRDHVHSFFHDHPAYGKPQHERSDYDPPQPPSGEGRFYLPCVACHGDFGAPGDHIGAVEKSRWHRKANRRVDGREAQRGHPVRLNCWPAERMRASLGQTVVIENVTGAGGSIGTGRVARAGQPRSIR